LKKDVIENGSYDVYSANVHQPFGKTDYSVLSDFTMPSIIWGIDGDWMVNYIEKDHYFNPTDHCGVMRVVDDRKIQPRFLAYALYEKGLEARFTRSNRASLQRIGSLVIQVPSIQIQNEIVGKISSYDEEFNELEKCMSECDNNKQAILDKYLK